MQSFSSLRKFLSALVLRALFLVLIAGGAWAQTASTPAPQSTAAQSAPKQPAAKDEGVQMTDTPVVDPNATGLDPETGLPYYREIHEDWSSLQVGTSELRPEKPLETMPDDAATFTRTMVALKWRPGDALDVYVIMPKSVKKPAAVLYLYNYSDDTERFRNDGWCQRVTGGGVAAIGFVAALSGHRFHDRPMKQWFVSELQESLGSTVHDVKFILDYLASRGDIDMDRIGMFGQGSGGTIALLAAAADSRIKAVDALDPWGDWPNWMAKTAVGADDPNRESRLKPEFLKSVAPLDPVDWLPKLQTPYIRIQQNLDDGATPLVSKDRIRDAAPKRTEFRRFDSTQVFMAREGGGILFDWVKDAVDKPVAPAAAKSAAMASGDDPQSSKKAAAHQ